MPFAPDCSRCQSNVRLPITLENDIIYSKRNSIKIRENMSQSLSQLWIHIVFSTKNRYPFLKDLPLRERIYDYMASICSAQNCHTAIIGGTEDHVHFLTKLHKNISLSAFVEEVKKSSSKWIKTLHDSNNELDNFYWQRGYAAFSVSQSQMEIVKEYIKNQEKHHKKRNFQDELRQLLIQHSVSYEEKYIWE